MFQPFTNMNSDHSFLFLWLGTRDREYELQTEAYKQHNSEENFAAQQKQALASHMGQYLMGNRNGTQVCLQWCTEKGLLHACQTLIERFEANPDCGSHDDARHPRDISKGVKNIKIQEYFNALGCLFGRYRLLSQDAHYESHTSHVWEALDVMDNNRSVALKASESLGFLELELLARHQLGQKPGTLQEHGPLAVLRIHIPQAKQIQQELSEYVSTYTSATDIDAKKMGGPYVMV